MPYNPSTDFVGLWRAISGGVEKNEMPGLDFVVAALGRAGILRVVFSATAPTTNQSTTAWFQPANPSYAAEGALFLWNGTAYVPATPELFNGGGGGGGGGTAAGLIPVTGAPLDGTGVDGDFAIRLDAPGGIYGPKAGGHWPTTPLPGTSFSQISQSLDQLGTVQGSIIFRNAASWDVLQPGTSGQVLATSGTNANPHWIDAATSPTTLSSAAFPQEVRFTTPGNTTWTVPTGVTIAEVSVYGGGGGGGTGHATFVGGGGGGSGGYARKKFTGLVPGTIKNVTVGSGGAGGAGGSSTNASGAAGNTSSFGGSVTATGGDAGSAGINPIPGIPASGGTGSGGDINLPGGWGSAGASGTNTNGQYTGYGGLGGSAPGPEGGKGGPMSTASVGPGGNYGAGGSGGGAASASGNNVGGGNGANGIVVIKYVVPS